MTAATDAVASDQMFGAALLRQLGEGPSNAVCSPASAAAALRLALVGAEGRTAAEIAAALRLAAASPGDAARLAGAGGPAAVSGRALALPGLRLREEALAALSGGPALLRAPASLWLQSGLELAPGFRDALAGLSVAAREADFRAASERARRDVNAWISEQTESRIEDLLAVGSIGQSTRLVLANAVYLNADWARPFPPGATADGEFRTGSGHLARTPMMRLTARLPYLRGDGYQVVVLPLAGGGLAMTVVLPDGPLQPVEDELAERGLAALTDGVGPVPLRLLLPRFRLRTRVDLGSALRRLGIAAAFGAEAEFGGITAARPLSLGPVAHMAFADVDERGVEAAAATGVGMVALSAVAAELEMRVDRPFLFAITDTRQGTPFFLGRVTDPAG